MGITYKDAGVDISAGDALVKRIGPLAAATRRPEVLSPIGGFAGLCGLPERYQEPVLVSGTDGVGTKLKIAFATGTHNSVGIDLVAMVVNDILVTSAEPLFFLDYFATGKLDVDVASSVVAGIADGCKQAGCALLGGETAELPGMYADNEYDLAGFAVGVAEKSDVRDGSELRAGDRVIGLPSAGLHSNGFSLARRALLEELKLDLASKPDVLQGRTLGEELLTPTRIYKDAFAALENAGIRFKAASHITGGGLIENPPRMLADDKLCVTFDGDWHQPRIFDLIAEAGVDTHEMRRTFNLGLGMLLAVAPEDTDAAITALAESAPGASAVATLNPRDGGPAVRFEA